MTEREVMTQLEAAGLEYLVFAIYGSGTLTDDERVDYIAQVGLLRRRISTELYLEVVRRLTGR